MIQKVKLKIRLVIIEATASYWIGRPLNKSDYYV